jgi:hypothetical protein
MSQALSLYCHVDTPGAAVRSVQVEVQRRTSQQLRLCYQISADLQALRVPPVVTPRRRDELWQHSCCELFVADDDGYSEYNFSPSGCWAAYRFDGYRAGRRDLAVLQAPAVQCHSDAGNLVLTAQLELAGQLPAEPTPFRIALAVVIESSDGALSYWALRHAPGRADFHHAAGFVKLEL